MVVAVRVKQRPPSVVEQRLMGRGLPTDRRVQDQIAGTIFDAVRQLLNTLWVGLWERVRSDVAGGRIKPMEGITGVATKQELLFDESSF